MHMCSFEGFFFCLKIGSAILLKIRNILLEYERIIECKKNRYTAVWRDVRKLESEKESSQLIAEETQDLKSILAHQEMEWKSDIQSLKYVTCVLIMCYFVSVCVPEDADGTGNRMKNFLSSVFRLFESHGQVLL